MTNARDRRWRDDIPEVATAELLGELEADATKAIRKRPHAVAAYFARNLLGLIAEVRRLQRQYERAESHRLHLIEMCTRLVDEADQVRKIDPHKHSDVCIACGVDKRTQHKPDCPWYPA